MSFDDPMGIYQVDYQAHYDQYAAPFIGPNSSSAEYFEHQAMEAHVDAVSGALNRLIFHALTMLDTVALTPKSEYYLRFGVMRRIRLMQSALCDFRGIVFPSRTEPLSRLESDNACRDLNAMYIHILGLSR